MERTDHLDFDALLARLLTEPTYAARLLIETAEELEQSGPFFVVTPDIFDEAAATAAAIVLHGLPDVVAAESAHIAAAALPAVRAWERETGGEYALRLRAVAREL